MDLTVIMSENQLPMLGLIFFSALGYLNGWLIKEIAVLKIIALIIILPTSLDTLIKLNHVYTATIPFLISAWFGYYSIRKTVQKCKDIYEAIR